MIKDGAAVLITGAGRQYHHNDRWCEKYGSKDGY